ncbi:MAG: alkaline phosphatase [Tissierellia bacterium]|nr:alkaline phosphatase [Tissierellia bacterium]
MKKTFRTVSLALAMTMGLGQASVFAAAPKAEEDKFGTAKNIIVMIPDGASVEAITLARWVDDDHSLNMDDMATGLVRTNNANTPIADSAPAGTAMATGVKSESPFVGSYPTKAGMPGAEPFEEARAKMPLANILEAAERLGKSTGIIATSNIQHATPADFSAHHPNRNDFSTIAEHQVYQGMEVVLGGGYESLSPEGRTDKEDLIPEIKALGYDYVTNTAEMKAATGEKLWGMFAADAMKKDLDRDPAQEPSLEEMTAKALEILSKNDNGFFLMVEGSQPDWAGHANDPVSIVSEILAYDRAVGVAKEFAKNNPGTVLISATDHGTGGMTIGDAATTKGYDKAPLDSFISIIKSAKMTPEGAAALVAEDRSNFAQVAKEAFGLDLTEEEVESVKDIKYLDTAFGDIISKRSHIGWTTGGHVGGDVGLYVLANGDAKPLMGTVHNSEIGQYMADLFDVDLRKLTDELYIYSRDALEAKGATVAFNYNSGNPILEVEKDGNKYSFPTNKNYALVNGEKVDLGGLVVFNGEKIYIPKTAVELVK